MHSIKLILGLGALVIVSGCARDNFGQSVRHMIRAQTYNPAAGVTAPEISGLDGDKAAMALKIYRSDKYGTAASAPAGNAIIE